MVVTIVACAAFVLGFILGGWNVLREAKRNLKPTPGMPPKDAASAPQVGIQRMDGSPLPARKAWGEIPYDELGPMFLDQFLLRYFLQIIKLPDGIPVTSPWHAFCFWNPWAMEMPLLFEQLTSYKLNDMQLNNAIAEYIRRLRSPQVELVIVDSPDSAAIPEPRETEQGGYIL